MREEFISERPRCFSEKRNTRSNGLRDGISLSKEKQIILNSRIGESQTRTVESKILLVLFT